MRLFTLFIAISLVGTTFSQQERLRINFDISFKTKADSIFTFDYIVKIENNDTVNLYCNYHPHNKSIIENNDTLIIEYKTIRHASGFVKNDTLLCDLNNFYIGSVGFAGAPGSPGFSFIQIKSKTKKYLIFREEMYVKNLEKQNIICRYIIYSSENAIQELNKYVLSWNKFVKTGECHIVCKHFILTKQGKVLEGSPEVARKYLFKKFPIW